MSDKERNPCPDQLRFIPSKGFRCLNAVQVWTLADKKRAMQPRQTTGAGVLLQESSMGLGGLRVFGRRRQMVLSGHRLISSKMCPILH